MSDIANLDFDRADRRGFPEAVFCAGKTPGQCADIATEWKHKYATTDNPRDTLGVVLFTKADAPRQQAITQVLPDAAVYEDENLVVWPASMPSSPVGDVVVVCAGTSDVPILREASLTATYLGRNVTEIVDVGVAGLHRIISQLDILRRADVIVVVAGMDGALPSVVAGLVTCPVIAVPTSVGYGASMNGLAALLSMLSSCSPGVAVVNIDNGYGAGYLAAQISAQKGKHHA